MKASKAQVKAISYQLAKRGIRGGEVPLEDLDSWDASQIIHAFYEGDKDVAIVQLQFLKMI